MRLHKPQGITFIKAKQKKIMPLNLLVRTGSLTAVLAFFCLIGRGQLVANFSATPVSGCAPLVVNFNDLSTGNPTSWRWDLGNATTAIIRNPSVTYFNPGEYTIKLVIRNASGADSITKTQYITVFAAPTVNFSGTPLLGCFPLPVQFTDLSTPGAGSTNIQWQWDFGDGNSSTVRNPSHTYTAGGNYNVSLRVTNSNGCVKTLTKPAYVQLHSGLTANFSNTVPTSCTAPLNIVFTNLTVGTGVLSYQWSFGDGGTSTLQNPTHNYINPGSYTVRLIVSNTTDCSDTITRVNAVTVGSVQANFSAPLTACINTGVQFTNTSVPAPVNVLWRFGDGTTSSALHPIKSYSTPGVYQVKLVSNFGGCKDSIVKPITVLPRPVSSFTGSPITACQAPLTVNFTNTSLGATAAAWDFGDGTTSTQLNPSHTYTSMGTYTVRLINSNAAGCSDTLVRQDYVILQLPSIEINNLPAQGCAPLTIPFGANVGTSEPITSYYWEFGDGTTSTLTNPTHTYSAGTFTVKLTIVTASVCTNSVIYSDGVMAGILPTANFIANPLNVCAEFPISFTNLSTGSIDQYAWDFGDGGFSDLENPMYVYTDTGFFDVQLLVTNNGCSDSVTFPRYIHIDPPVAKFSNTFGCGSIGQIVFTDQSIGADTWTWDFGDGDSSTIQHPSHNYTNPGTYRVTLTVTNDSTGCSYSKSSDIIVLLASSDFSSTDTIICRNTSALFNAGSGSSNIGSYEWNFGDGFTGIGDSISHVYRLAGDYDVSLITVDLNGCRDTLLKPRYIRVNGPTANFGVQSITTCSINVVPILDSSVSDGIHPINTWTWNFGDGTSATLPSGPFQHFYTTPGQYDISLTIKDSEGCMDSIIKNSVLTISQPAAEFVTDTIACPGQSLKFTNLSEGNDLNFTWDFGDGVTSTADTPFHSYAANGIYTVKLYTIDPFGCTDTIVKTNYIRITTPLANFSVSDTVGTCPPLVVSFTNGSSNYTSLSWDFGDGTFSQSPDPSHFYSSPGVYHAKLTVGISSGCTSVKTKTIVVRGPQGTFTYGGLMGCNDLTVNFVASTRDRLSFIWDFNDGNTLVTTDSLVSHTYSTLGNYVPKMILRDAGGCVVPITGLDTIRIKGVTTSFDMAPQTFCNSGSVQFNNTSITNDGFLSYRWDFGDGHTSSIADPVHVYDTTGIYYPKLTVTTLSGCVDSLTSRMPVRIVANPQAAIVQSANGCTPVNVTFNGSLLVPDTSVVTWRWNFGNGDSSALQNPGLQTYSVAGIYNVALQVTNSSGCKDTLSTTVEAFVIPQVSAGNDREICQGVGSTLQAVGAVTYTWNQTPGLSCYNCSNPIATPDTASIYSVTGTSAQGCTDIDSIMVLVIRPLQLRDSGPDTLCLGRSAPLVVSGAYTYQWSPSTGLNSTTVSNPIATPTSTTVYTVVGTDHKNCFTDTAYIPIKVYPIPTVNAGLDKTINVGQMTDLVPEISRDVVNVIWSPTGSIFRNHYPAITVKPRETTEYQVLVTNEGGCRSRDLVTINVICNGANVFIPNTFSPNGDGMNDVFYARGTGLFSVKTARVYNRWGEIVYERNNFQSDDVSAGWDGTYKGVKLSPDVYVYTIDILCDNNTVLPFKGNIALIK